ncbi:MAG: outer membrane lipoprotein-sorting protein [Bacteroidetes bacterium]|jgi:outer membrane lipoprotein-sorting protein|nr:outer membrane lipoprotein-sorting protein [Bacteroidota bacterium]
MKKFILFIAAALAFSATLSAQMTAEEIIDTYLENIGGKDNLAALENMMFKAQTQAQGMQIPITMYQTADGQQRMDMVFQGRKITQMAFDGETGWSTNFQTGQAEKMDAEQSKLMKTQTGDFPDPFLNYEEKGYTVSLEGEEEVEGTMTYKIKLTKDPVTVQGEEVENFTYYYFDKDALVPIMQEDFVKAGPTKGQASRTYSSDYQEVGDVYMPFSITQKMNGQTMFSVKVDEYKVNQELEDGLFAFPGDSQETEESDK